MVSSSGTFSSPTWPIVRKRKKSSGVFVGSIQCASFAYLPSIQGCSEALKCVPSIQRCSETFRDVQRCSKTFRDAQGCSKTFRDVQETKHFTQDGLVFWKKQFIPSFPSSLFRLSHSISTLTSPCSLHLIHGMHAHDSDLPSIASIKSLTRRTAPGAPALVVRSTSNTYLTSFLHSASYWTMASSLSTMRSTRPMR